MTGVPHGLMPPGNPPNQGSSGRIAVTGETKKVSKEPKGCICPPTSEQTCLRKDCGRK